MNREDLISDLGVMMSDISEKCYCASWLIDAEYYIPALCERAIFSEESQPWGQDEVTVEEAVKMTKIVDQLHCWVSIIYKDKCFEYVEFNPFTIPDKFLKELDERLQSTG